MCYSIAILGGFMIDKERTFKIRKIESYENQLKANKTDTLIAVLGLSGSIGAVILGKGVLAYSAAFIGAVNAVNLYRVLLKKSKLKEELQSLEQELANDDIKRSGR